MHSNPFIKAKSEIEIHCNPFMKAKSRKLKENLITQKIFSNTCLARSNHTIISLSESAHLLLCEKTCCCCCCEHFEHSLTHFLQKLRLLSDMAVLVYAILLIASLLNFSTSSAIRKPDGDDCNGVICDEGLICASEVNSS